MPDQVDVTITTNGLSPDPIVIHVNDAIVWKNQDSVARIVKSKADNGGTFRTDTVVAGRSSLPITFAEPDRTIQYTCEIEGGTGGLPNELTGTVVVYK
jgi:hypothetical protein